MRKYTSPRTEVVFVQLTTTLLSASGGNNMPISNTGAEQIESW